MRGSWLLLAISLLAIAGIVLSSASLVNHYKKSATDYCDLSENFNCDVVNRSEYSEIARIPVAAIGIAGYAFLLVMSRLAAQRPAAAWAMLTAAVAGLGFALYLAYIEAYVLDAWCILCLGSLAAVCLIAVISAAQVARHLKKSAQPSMAER